jgi:hypothetical protein
LLAVIVVPLVVPSTRTLSPLVMALAETELVPLLYFVEDAFLMVTFWPAPVSTVKLEPETLATVPDDPPAAGTERALDPPLPRTPCLDADDAVVAAAAPVLGDEAVTTVEDPVLAVALTIP